MEKTKERVSAFLGFQGDFDIGNEFLDKPPALVFVSDLKEILSSFGEKLSHVFIGFGPNLVSEPVECVYCGHEGNPIVSRINFEIFGQGIKNRRKGGYVLY